MGCKLPKTDKARTCPKAGSLATTFSIVVRLLVFIATGREAMKAVMAFPYFIMSHPM